MISQAREIRSGRSPPGVNVDGTERMASTALGGVLLLLGLRNRSIGGLVTALAGGTLVYRGLSGRCSVYQALGVNTADTGARSTAGAPAAATDVERSITVDRPAGELHRIWREPGTLPQVMRHFAEVTVKDEHHAHWTVRGPGGRSLEWDTQVVEDRPGELLRWESVEGADLRNEGTLRFRPAAGDRGTEVALRVRFAPPGGALGGAAMRLFGFVPSTIAGKALRRFKSLVETGEMPTLERNPSARGMGDTV